MEDKRIFFIFVNIFSFFIKKNYSLADKNKIYEKFLPISMRLRGNDLSGATKKDF